MNERQELYATYQVQVSAGDTVLGIANSEKERIDLMQEAQKTLPGEVVNVRMISKFPSLRQLAEQAGLKYQPEVEEFARLVIERYHEQQLSLSTKGIENENRIEL
jgi:hypothetical protein